MHNLVLLFLVENNEMDAISIHYIELSVQSNCAAKFCISRIDLRIYVARAQRQYTGTSGVVGNNYGVFVLYTLCKDVG